MSLRFSFSDIDGDFGDTFNGYFDPIKRAATGAIKDVSELAKNNGRAEIASAGFSRKWQNTLRSDAYPKRGFSVNSAAWIYHRIPYAGVFEEGASIRGRPRLWIPLSGTPRLTGRNKLNPRNFEMQIGKLFPMKNARKPLLGARIGLTASAANKGPPYRVTRAALRRGAAGTGVIRTVPIFVGVDTVNIRKKFDLRTVFDRAANQLPQLYLNNLRV